MIEPYMVVYERTPSIPETEAPVGLKRERRQCASPLAATSSDIDVLLKSMIRCVGLIVAGWCFVLMSVCLILGLDT